MTATRTERRLRLRHLRDFGTAALKLGLPRTPARDQVLGLAVVIGDTLADAARADRASEAAAIMHRVAAASVKASPPALALACRAGCAWCCSTWVSATAPELFLIARLLTGRKRPDTLPPADALAERLAAIAGVGIAARFGRKLPCALLVDDRCSVYAARPAACRQATSTDLAACIEEYEGKDYGGDVVVSRAMIEHIGNAQLPLRVALAGRGLSVAAYELSAGLLAATQARAEARWLAGEDVFAGVATAPAEVAEVARVVAALAEELRQLG